MIITLSQAISLVKQGDVIALPTDTVWGLAALPSSQHKIYQLKGRPSEKPLITLISSYDQLPPLPPGTRSLIDKYWPGALTIIPHDKGYRMPNHPLLLDLIAQTGPIVATSANLSDTPPLETPTAIEHAFGPTFPILPSDLPLHGTPSTIIKYSDGQWQTLRQGSIVIPHN
ncbi:MAG: L-threonylcarbamoyladenylate synthase [Chlamydiia bacterium]|nr:L-threonylcarbamoyladenylate synthase [Chlamydiia bacterium]